MESTNVCLRIYKHHKTVILCVYKEIDILCLQRNRYTSTLLLDQLSNIAVLKERRTYLNKM